MSKKNDRKIFESILSKIHNASGEEGLKKFISSKGEDMPPIKLTDEEMKYLKGGMGFNFSDDDALGNFGVPNRGLGVPNQGN